MIAHIVPVLRLRRDTSWWSYKVPAKLPLQPGCLVTVPFRGRQELGVVWELETDDSNATESISQLVNARPLVLAPHRNLIEILAQEGICSLSTALYMWMPAGLRGLPLGSDARNHLARFDASEPTAGPQQAVLIPGRRPRQEAAVLARPNAALLFSDTPKEELERWFSIARGETASGIGREAALFAPWRNLTRMTVAEPEDIAYHHEQSPYLSLVAVASQAYPVSFKSRLPDGAAKAVYGSAASGTVPLAVTVRPLSRMPMLSDELLADIRSALSEGRQVLLVLNAHDRSVPDPESPGGTKTVPGIESLRRKLCAALGRETLEPDIALGTRTVMSEPLERLGLAVLLLADPLLTAHTFADLLHGAADLSYLASLGVPCVAQTYRPEDPLMISAANGLLDRYLSERIEEHRASGLPPFGTLVACSYAGSDQEAARLLHEKLAPLLQGHWRLSQPLSAPWRKKPFVHLLLQAPAGARMPSALRAALAKLPRPWRIQRDPWYLA